MGPSTPLEEFFLMKFLVSHRLLHLHTARGWVGQGGQGGGCGRRERQGDSSLTESSPHVGAVFCGDKLNLGGSEQEGAGKAFPYFFQ